MSLMKRAPSKIPLFLIILAGAGVLILLFAASVSLLFRFWNRASEIPEAEWKQFAPENGDFVILMPGKPILQPEQKGEAIQFRQFLVDRKKEAAAYLVGYVDIPETEVKKHSASERLRLMMKAMAERYPGSVVKSEEEIPLGDVPGRELNLEVPGKGIYILRVYVKGRRIFLLVVGGPSVRADSKDVQKFFGFFTIYQREASPPPPALVNRQRRPPQLPAHGNRQPLPPQPLALSEENPNEGYVRFWGLGRVRSLTFTPDSRTLVVLTSDVFLWDQTSRRMTASLKKDFGFWSMSMAHDGNTIATGERGMVQFWDRAKREVRATATLPPDAKTRMVECLAYSPDGKQLAVAWDNQVHLWDAATGKEQAVHNVHDSTVRCLVFSADGSKFASLAGSGEIKVCDTASGSVLATFPASQYNEAVNVLAFSHDGRTLASATHLVQLWDLEKKRERLRVEALAFTVAVAPDGKWIAYDDSRKNTIVVASMNSAEPLARLPAPGGGEVRAIAFSPDGKWLSMGNANGEVRVFDLTRVVK